MDDKGGSERQRSSTKKFAWKKPFNGADGKMPNSKLRRKSKGAADEAADDPSSKSPRSPGTRFFRDGRSTSNASLLSQRTKSGTSLSRVPSSNSHLSESDFESIFSPQSLPPTPTLPSPQPVNSGTNDFFAKMGFWLYNTKVVQYIAKGDERSHRKTSYSTETVWLLGKFYQFIDDGQEEVTIFQPEPKRSRKAGSIFGFPWPEDNMDDQAAEEVVPSKARSFSGYGSGHEWINSNDAQLCAVSASNGKLPSAANRHLGLSHYLERRTSTSTPTQGNQSPVYENAFFRPRQVPDKVKLRVRRTTTDDNAWKKDIVMVERPEVRLPDDEGEGVLVDNADVGGSSGRLEESVIVVDGNGDIANNGVVLISRCDDVPHHRPRDMENPFWIVQPPRPKSLHEFPITPGHSKHVVPSLSLDSRSLDFRPTENQQTLQLFLKDFESRVGFTYRRGFPPVGDTFYTSDTGFGCMHRTTMSLLANTLIIHLFGRDWRKPVKGVDNWTDYVKLMEQFLDLQDPTISPFSFHRMALYGKTLGRKNVGEWFGPSTASIVIKHLVESYEPCNIAVHIVTDNVIYKKDINPQPHGSSGCKPLLDSDKKDKIGFKPTLILIATRLGVNGVNPIYYEALKACFAFPQSVGIAGGRPNSSLYFVGFQGDDLLCIDPHTTHDALELKPTTEFTDADFSTYHNAVPNSLDISQLDPSMLIGFYVQNAAEFEDFCVKAIEVSEKGRKAIFTVSDSAKETHERKMAPDDVMSEDEKGEL